MVFITGRNGLLSDVCIVVCSGVSHQSAEEDELFGTDVGKDWGERADVCGFDR